MASKLVRQPSVWHVRSMQLLLWLLLVHVPDTGAKAELRTPKLCHCALHVCMQDMCTGARHQTRSQNARHCGEGCLAGWPAQSKGPWQKMF